MAEMDEPKFESSDWSGHPVASEVAERIRSVIGAAEAAAGAVRHEAEQQAASRRRAAEEESRRLVEDAKRDAKALLDERVRRINELSDSIIERSETILSRLDRADEVRRELQSLVDELGHTAARLAREAGEERDVEPAAPAVERDSVLDRVAETAEVAPEPEPEPVREPEPEPVVEAEPEPEPAAEAEESAVDEPVTEEVEPEPAAEAPAEETPRPLRVARVEEQPDPGSITDLPARPPERSRAEEDDQLLGARLVALQMAVAGGNRGEVESHLIRAFDLPNPQSILDDVFGRGTDSTKRVVWPSAADGS
jgi:predicted metal-dependent hydrolase